MPTGVAGCHRGDRGDSIAEMVSAAATRRRFPSAAAADTFRATVALCVMLFVGGTLIVYAGRHLTFFYDEWAFILTRRGGGLHTFLDPHNGHLVLFPVLVYKLLFATVGLRHYFPYELITVLLHLLCCALLFGLVRHRVGPWLALASAALLLFMGSAWQVLLWPFQIGYLASVAGGLGALLLLERPRPRREAFASALLVWSIASSGVGIPFVAAVAVLLIARRRPWRQLWVPALPLFLFAVWYAGWGGGEHTTTDALLGAPQYVADAAAAATAGLAGLDAAWGPPLAVGLIAALVFRLRRDLSFTSHSLLFAAATGALVFWGLAAVTRADSPDPAASRYLYVGAVFIVLAIADAGRGLNFGPMTLAAIALLVAAAVISNLHALRGGERGLRGSDDSVRTALGATQIAAPVVAPAFEPDRLNAPQVTAGPYLSAVRDLGSPARTPGELLASPESTRAAADAVLRHAEALTLLPGTNATHGSCSVLRATNGREGTLAITVPPGRVLSIAPVPGRSSGLSTPAQLYLRRIAAVFPPQPFATIAAGAAATLKFPGDLAPTLPWHGQIVSARPLRACAT